MKMNRFRISRMRLALGFFCALCAGFVSAQQPKAHGTTPPAGAVDAKKQDLKQLAQKFNAVTNGMTRDAITQTVGVSGRLRNDVYDLKVGEVTGITIEDGKVTGTWSSGSEQESKIIDKITFGMRESDVRRQLAGRTIAKCAIYRWGTDEFPFDVSFANGKAFRISQSQIP